MKALALVLIILSLAGCAVFTKADPVTVSAETAAIVGEQAIATNQQYVALCGAKKLSVEKCQAWATFFVDFKGKYAAAHAAFKQAAAGGNIQSAQDAARVIQALATQLVLYSLYAGGK